MKLKRSISLILAAVMLALCLCACGGSEEKTQNSNTDKTADTSTSAPADADSSEEEIPADNHEGMVTVNLIKSISTLDVESGSESRCEISRDQFGNPILCEQINSKKETFKAEVKDEIASAKRYTATLDKDGDSYYMEYLFGDDGKLTEIIYHSGSTKISFAYAPAGTDVDGAVYYVEDIGDSRTQKYYYNGQCQRLYSESQSKGKEATWNKYYYREDGTIEKRDTYGYKGLRTRYHCETGRDTDQYSPEEALEVCTVEKDASGRIVKEKHYKKVYTYQYNADGTLASYDYQETLDNGELGSTTTYRDDGSIETESFYQVSRSNRKTVQTDAFDAFYVRDDALLIAFFKMAADLEIRSGGNASDTCFGVYCSLETLSHRW